MKFMQKIKTLFPGKHPDFEIKKGVLIDYHGNGGNVIIPEGVREIQYRAFRYCTALTGITIPKTVTMIGNHAFDGCTSLTEITIPEGVTDIRGGAFRGCTGLKSVILPESLQAVGIDRNAPGYDYEEEDEDICYDYEVASDEDSFSPELGKYLTDFNEHDVTGAFEDCTSLKEITIPENIQFIDRITFQNCPNLNIRYRDYTFKMDIRCEININALITMIRTRNPQYIGKVFSILISRQRIDTIKQFLESGEFITKETIDFLIRYAIEQKNYEIQLMLMNHKARKIGYDDIETTVRKKFEL